METLETASGVARPENPGSIGLLGLPMLIPVPQAAHILGISRSAAYRCAASGELPTMHLGGRVYVLTERLRELLSA